MRWLSLKSHPLYDLRYMSGGVESCGSLRRKDLAIAGHHWRHAAEEHRDKEQGIANKSTGRPRIAGVATCPLTLALLPYSAICFVKYYLEEA